MEETSERLQRIADVVRQFFDQAALPRCQIIKFPKRPKRQPARELQEELDRASSKDE